MKASLFSLSIVTTSITAQAETIPQKPNLVLKMTGGATSSIDGKTMSVDYQKPTDIADIIDLMSRASKKNVILSKDARSKMVAVSFQNEPLDIAYEKLKHALEENDLVVTEESNHVVRVQLKQ